MVKHHGALIRYQPYIYKTETNKKKFWFKTEEKWYPLIFHWNQSCRLDKLSWYHAGDLPDRKPPVWLEAWRQRSLPWDVNVGWISPDVALSSCSAPWGHAVNLVRGAGSEVSIPGESDQSGHQQTTMNSLTVLIILGTAAATTEAFVMFNYNRGNFYIKQWSFKSEVSSKLGTSFYWKFYHWTRLTPESLFIARKETKLNIWSNSILNFNNLK